MMKVVLSRLALVACAAFTFAGAAAAAQVSPRSRESFNDGLAFSKGRPAGGGGSLELRED